LKDAGIDFEDIRYAYDDTWPATSADLKAKGITVTGQVPTLEYNGTILAQVCPLFPCLCICLRLVILTLFLARANFAISSSGAERL
jgi:hypothetical protein